MLSKVRSMAVWLVCLFVWAPCLAPGQGKTAVSDLPRKAIDLSHPVSATFPNWEGAKQSPFRADVAGTVERDGYMARTFHAPEHFSTHIDAPAHFGAGQATVEKLGPEKLFLPAAVIDVRAAVARDADYALSAQDVLAWEKKNGSIRSGEAVLLSTGWSARAGDMAAYRNADAKGVMHFPGFSVEAAKLLVERGAVALGIDNLSIDPGRQVDFAAHRYTQPRGLYHLENLTNLDKLPARVFLIVAPIKLEGGSGGQVRVWAVP